MAASTRAAPPGYTIETYSPDEDGMEEEVRPLIEEDGQPCKGFDAIEYDRAQQLAGFGRFQYILTGICGWANASDAVEILCISFVIPFVECDMGPLTGGQAGILGSITFIGMMVGGYFWGFLADRHGRRQVLIVSLMVNALSALGSAVCQTFIPFLLLRLVSGIGVGGSIPVVFSYMAEFQPNQHRGKMIGIVAMFWMCGNIIAASLAWALIPLTLGRVAGWRVFIAACTLPSISSSLVFLLLPESPKFLNSVGRELETARVFNIVQRLNFGYVRSPIVSVRSGVREARPVYGSFLKKLTAQAIGITQQTLALFKPPLTRTTVVLSVQMFTLSFGYYGLWMWLPTLLNQTYLAGGHGSPCSPPLVNATSPDAACTPETVLAPNVYRDTFITSLSNLPGNIFTIIFVDWIGRRLLIVGSLLVSGLSVLLVLVADEAWQTLLTMTIFGGVSVICWNVLDVLLTELFPTDKRSLAIGFITLVGRIGSILANLAFGMLLDTYCVLPLLLVSSLMILGSLFSLCIPETRNANLQ